MSDVSIPRSELLDVLALCSAGSMRLEEYKERIEQLDAEHAIMIEALETIADECEIEFQWASNVARGALKRVGK